MTLRLLMTLLMTSPTPSNKCRKTTIITTHSARLSLTRHKGKSKILNVNDNNTTPIRLEGEALEEVETYLSV